MVQGVYEDVTNDMQTKHEQEILRIKSEMNEEHKHEIIAKEDQIATLQTHNQQMQVETEQNAASNRSKAVFFTFFNAKSLLALDNG